MQEIPQIFHSLSRDTRNRKLFGKLSHLAHSLKNMLIIDHCHIHAIMRFFQQRPAPSPQIHNIQLTTLLIKSLNNPFPLRRLKIKIYTHSSLLRNGDFLSADKFHVVCVECALNLRNSDGIFLYNPVLTVNQMRHRSQSLCKNLYPLRRQR